MPISTTPNVARRRKRPSNWKGVHSDRKSPLNGGRFGLLHRFANHAPELGRVLVGMHRDRVLDGGFDEHIGPIWVYVTASREGSTLLLACSGRLVLVHLDSLGGAQRTL
jgi:hypothetical protein